MKDHVVAAPVRCKFLEPWVYPVIGLVIVGFAFALYRFLFGIGAVTNLSMGYPWGIWKAIGVAAGVALATGGFTTAALVHVFHREKYASILRLSLLVALLGYVFGTTSLLVDLGRYYNVWHPILPSMWQGDSVLFEVAMCIMTYTMILVLEFLPIVHERFSGKVALPGPLAKLNAPVETALRLAGSMPEGLFTVVLLIGMVLSCMHHSSLGALMLVAPYKMHALWYTPVLPLLFLLSIFSGGFAAVICVSFLCSWMFRRKPDMAMLSSLGRYVFVFLAIYFAAKMSDVAIRNVLPDIFVGDAAAWMFLLEVGAGIVLPLVMLGSSRLRSNEKTLFIACACIVFGVVLNRTNAFLTAFHSFYTPRHYFPSLGEILITLGLFAAFFLIFRALVIIFPVLTAAGEEPLLLSEAHEEV